MKKNILLILPLFGLLFACKKYEFVEPVSLREIIQKLWILKRIEVTENGLPADDVAKYNGFTIAFEGEKYFVSNGHEAFPLPEGRWGFDDMAFSIIDFDGQVKATITKLDASNLHFTFTRKGRTINGRIPDRTFKFELVAFR